MLFVIFWLFPFHFRGFAVVASYELLRLKTIMFFLVALFTVVVFVVLFLFVLVARVLLFRLFFCVFLLLSVSLLGVDFFLCVSRAFCVYVFAVC